MLMVAQFLPSAIVGLFAGVVVDRLPRKLVMIAAEPRQRGAGAAVPAGARCQPDLDHLRGGDPENVAGRLFRAGAHRDHAECDDPRGADRRQRDQRRDMVGDAGDWRGAGRLVAGTLGTDAAFIIDSASFVLAALFIWAVPVHETHLSERQPRPAGSRSFARGWRLCSAIATSRSTR